MTKPVLMKGNPAPKEEGVYALIASDVPASMLASVSGVDLDPSVPYRVAYVSKTHNLRLRRAQLEYQMRLVAEGKKPFVPVKGLPSLPAERWTYAFWTNGVTAEDVQKVMRDAGVHVIGTGREVTKITYEGKTGTLAWFAREYNVNYDTLYSRWYKGLRGDDLIKGIKDIKNVGQ